jgi:hypothetical protein
MKRAKLGTLVGIGLVIAAVAVAEQRNEIFAQRGTLAPTPPASMTGSEMVVVPTPLGEKGQMLTVVDPRMRVLCVYHIDTNGKIALKSVRNIQWDLQITDLNNEDPLPREIRGLLGEPK